MFFGRKDAEAETPVLWPPHAKNWLIGKDSDAGRDWGQEEKGTTEDEMAGWHHRLDRREFEWTPGVNDGQGGLACCNSLGHKESDTLSDWSELNWMINVEVLCVRKWKTLILCSLQPWYRKTQSSISRIWTWNEILILLLDVWHWTSLVQSKSLFPPL